MTKNTVDKPRESIGALYIGAVDGSVSKDLDLALSAMSLVPCRVDTHAQWMEVHRHLKSAKNSLQWLQQLAAAMNRNGASEGHPQARLGERDPAVARAYVAVG